MHYKNIDKNIFAFFLGLLEGDGSIQVNHWKKKYLQFRVIIKMKYTPKNHEMLSNIRDSLGIFKLHIRNNFVILVEDDKKQLKLLVKLIDSSNSLSGLLLTKVRIRYSLFKYALENNITYSELSLIQNNSEWLVYKNIKEYSLEELMTYTHLESWLLGFIEAESCFCIRKNGNHSFSISQKDELIIIELIKNLFKLPNKIQIKTNNLYLIETYNRKSLKIIIDFCQDKLKGEKRIQFNTFASLFYKI
tara:strand:+ start:15821 stop:16561 length:741 start_codon:yes stop_codon:yes gene_type:complete